MTFVHHEYLVVSTAENLTVVQKNCMLDQNVVEQTATDWLARIVVAITKEDFLCSWVDYRKSNPVTLHDSYRSVAYKNISTAFENPH